MKFTLILINPNVWLVKQFHAIFTGVYLAFSGFTHQFLDDKSKIILINPLIKISLRRNLH